MIVRTRFVAQIYSSWGVDGTSCTSVLGMPRGAFFFCLFETKVRMSYSNVWKEGLGRNLSSRL